MKQIILAILILFSFTANAQLTDSTAYKDSVLNSYANNTLNLKLPVKAIALYAYYYSRNFSWENRKAPDAYKPLIGTGTKPDSLVNVTITAKDLTEFLNHLQGERHGAVAAYNNSIFNNIPAIAGYTSLVNQVVTISNTGTQNQKNGAQYVITKYGAYSTNLTNMINQYYTEGIFWIQH